MIHKIFAWSNAKSRSFPAEKWVDRCWVLGLLLAALIMFGANLGGLPLRDWDEGIIAQVARDIWRAPPGSLVWLHPTIAGEPYLNKPPLMHWLIAQAYEIGGVNEWTTRLPGATLTALSVPLLYGVGRELFSRRTPAVFSALIYLTLLPVVRHGRLAMLDGAVVCFFLLMLWCLLKARRDLRWGLGVGIGFGLMCLTKGILGLLLGTIALLFLLWDTPRLLTSGYLWAGIGIGSAPVVLWCMAQWLQYSQNFGTNLIDQSLTRIWSTVEKNGGPPWYYLLEILKYSLPWLLFLPQGFRLAWENQGLGWAKLVLVWSSVYLIVISLMGTKLPWYVLPIYPALALVGGAQLADTWQGGWMGLQQVHHPYPRSWLVVLSLLALVGWGGSFYFGISANPEPDVQIILVAVALTMTVAAVLLAKRDSQFLPILFWGSYVSLLLLMTSQHWIWELAEAYPVKPVAEIVRQGTAIGQKVYTSYPYYRPSLDFYSDRSVIPASPTELQKRWQDPKAYLLLELSTLHSLALKQVRIVATAENWVLVTPASNDQ